MPSPIRVGIIGLGRGTGTMAPGLWAAKSHLPYILASPNYQLTAITNSTVESAQASIEYHQLGAGIKAYGSPEELADDPNVDLVIVSVNVGKHYSLTKPALLAGKDVFVEWPLGATTTEAEELTELAKAKGVKTIVGLQGRANPLVVKIKELVESGNIGKVLSSTVVGTFTGLPTGIWPAGAEYYLDINSGGNSLTISFGHFLDSFTHVLGPFASLSSILKTEFTSVNIINAEGEVITPDYPKTAPDHLLLHGTLSSGAIASIAYRTVPDSTAVDGVGIRWIITGSDGEIEITTPESQWQIGTPRVSVRARLGKLSEVEKIDFEDVEEVSEVKEREFPGGNTARVYQAYLEGKADQYADFKSSLETHRLLDRILEAAK